MKVVFFLFVTSLKLRRTDSLEKSHLPLFPRVGGSLPECQKLRNPPSLRDTMSQMNMVKIYLPNKWFIIHVEHVRAEFRSF